LVPSVPKPLPEITEALGENPVRFHILREDEGVTRLVELESDERVLLRSQARTGFKAELFV
jgi:hypothetical protein